MEGEGRVKVRVRVFVCLHVCLSVSHPAERKGGGEKKKRQRRSSNLSHSRAISLAHVLNQLHHGESNP